MDENLISVAEYAKRKGVDRATIYRKIQTPETPEGIIVPEVVNGKWRINWSTYKNTTWPSPKRRSKSLVK